MTPQEAIDTIKIAIAEVEWDYPMDYAVAFEEAIKALEKQIPRAEFCDMGQGWSCPTCGALTGGQVAYCPECGQRLE